MRIRTALLCPLAIAAMWLCSDAASALEVGPVPVSVQPPPVAVTVTVPPALTVGPVTVPVSPVAPGLGASATVSPSGGVTASVSLPASVGPVPVLPGAPHDVRVALGPSGADTQPAPSETAVAADVPGSDAQAPRTAAGLARGDTRAGTQYSLVPSAAGAQRANAPARVSRPPSTSIESESGAVDASLQQRARGGPWSLFRDLASAHGLWIALLLIIAVARFAAGGVVRDAKRRRPRLSST